MLVISIDGLNWKYASEIYKDLFKTQSSRMIRCDVRVFSMRGVSATPIGLTCAWSGERIKNLHPCFFTRFDDKYKKESFIWKDKNGNDLDLVWNHFKHPKFFEKVVGDSPYAGEQIWKFYHSLPNVKRVPCEELCIFAEAARKDYDLFWIHSSIVKGGVMFPGPYELGRLPALIPYDDIRKDKPLKKDVYLCGIRRYKEVIRWLEELSGGQTIVVTSDHGTLVDVNEPLAPQIDNIPLIVNRKIDLEEVRFQWNLKDLILKLKKTENI